MKKTVIIVSSLLFLFLCGCKKTEEHNLPVREINKNAVYKSETIEITLPDEYNNYELGEMVPCKEGIFFSCYKYEDEENKEDIDWALGYSDMQGNNAEIIDDLTDEDNNDISYMVQTLLGCGNECIAIDYYKNAKSEEGIEEQDYYDSPEYVGVFDKTGKKLAEKELQDYYPCKLIIDDSIILSDYSNIISWDYLKDKEIKCDAASYTDLLKGGSGALIAYGPDKEGNNEYIYIDAKTLEEEKRVKGTVSINNNDDIVVAGNTSDEFFIFSGKNILGYTPGDEQVHLICDGEYSGLYFGGSIRDTYVEENGDFYVLAEQYSNSYEPEFKLIKLVKIPPEEVKDREEISVACLGITFSDFDSFIAELNSSSDSYFYSVREYKEEEGSEDILSTINEFDKDLLADNAPDVIVAESSSLRGNYNINKYVSKGVFLPLNDLLEKDPEIDAEDIFPSLKEVCSYGGKIYTVIPNFYIRTMVAKENLCSNTDNWTYSAFDEVLKAHPGARPFYNEFRDEIISNFLAMENNAFFSLNAGTSNFNTEEFAKFLNLLKEYGDDYEYDTEDYEYDVKETRAYNEENALFYMAEVFGGEDLFVLGKNVFNDKVSAAGYPNNSGLNGYIVPRNYVLAISNKSKNPEAAWQFVRKFLTDEYQAEIKYSIPASMKAFDRLSEKLLAKENIQGWYCNDTVDLGPITEEEVMKVKNLILSSGANLLYDETIVGIIEEDAGAFFEGEKTAEEVAQIIDSRVSLYLKENMKV